MKNRVRMIVVLVCVFVVLPVVGGLVYLSRTSAQDAARYYAEAIAQGRFEDAMAMETDQASGSVEPENVDLRRGQIAVPSSVTSVSLVGVAQQDGTQAVRIGLNVNGYVTTRTITLRPDASRRGLLGAWKVTEGLATKYPLSMEGYASEVSVGGMTLGAVSEKGSDGTVIPLTVPTEGLWHRGSSSVVFVAYPGVYPVEVTTVGEGAEVLVDSSVGAQTIAFTRGLLNHRLEVPLDEETEAWQEEQFESLAVACVKGEKPEGVVCPGVEVSGVESVYFGGASREFGRLRSWGVNVETADERVLLNVINEVCFDDAGVAHTVLFLDESNRYRRKK